jgi:hypothetical protein
VVTAQKAIPIMDDTLGAVESRDAKITAQAHACTPETTDEPVKNSAPQAMGECLSVTPHSLYTSLLCNRTT